MRKILLSTASVLSLGIGTALANTATVTQTGTGNVGDIRQVGVDNTATLEQTGDFNEAVAQSHTFTNTIVLGAATPHTFGTGGTAPGPFGINQEGDRNSAEIRQTGDSNKATGEQIGDDNFGRIRQQPFGTVGATGGDFNRAMFGQYGNDNLTHFELQAGSYNFAAVWQISPGTTRTGSPVWNSATVNQFGIGTGYHASAAIAGHPGGPGSGNFAEVYQESTGDATLVANLVGINQGAPGGPGHPPGVTNNAAEAYQRGSGNTILIDQFSNNNTAEAKQLGDSNFIKITQEIGHGHSATAHQLGSGNSTTILQQ